MVLLDSGGLGGFQFILLSVVKRKVGAAAPVASVENTAAAAHHCAPPPFPPDEAVLFSLAWTASLRCEICSSVGSGRGEAPRLRDGRLPLNLASEKCGSET